MAAAELPDTDLIIPEYAIEQTYYDELRADDGVLLWRDECNQPVFFGTGERIGKMNAVFASEIPGKYGRRSGRAA
jgi:hypothetical protein